MCCLQKPPFPQEVSGSNNLSCLHRLWYSDDRCFHQCTIFQSPLFSSTKEELSTQWKICLYRQMLGTDPRGWSSQYFRPPKLVLLQMRWMIKYLCWFWKPSEEKFPDYNSTLSRSTGWQSNSAQVKALKCVGFVFFWSHRIIKKCLSLVLRRQNFTWHFWI